LFVGEGVLHLFGTDVASFAVAGAFVIFAIGIEMILGVRLFREDPASNNMSTVAYVPLAFPLIAGAGTLTTILSLKTEYGAFSILSGIAVNLAVIFVVLRFCGWFERRLGDAGLAVLRKVFGVILLSIAVKLFKTNLLV
jgi:multiple antibiotic resistance protein